MLRKLKVPAIVLVAVLLNQVAGYVVHAAVPDAFLASGSTRYAVAYAADEITNSSSTYADIPGMRASISIPEGKRGDVLLLFCAESWTDGTTRVSPWIAGAYRTPSSTQMRIRRLGASPKVAASISTGSMCTRAPRSSKCSGVRPAAGLRVWVCAT